MPLSDRQVLREMGWLSSTPKAFQDAVLVQGDVLKPAAGETLYLAGDITGGIFGVIEGQIELHLPGDRDAATLAHIAGPGHWHGDLAAVLGHQRRFTILARSACRVLRLRRAELTSICAKEPAYWRHFAELSAINLGAAVSVVAALRRKNPATRVAAELLVLSAPQPGTSVIHASQADIGAITGLSRAAVNAALGKLEQRGWIKRSYAAVEIVDRDAIEAFTQRS